MKRTLRAMLAALLLTAATGSAVAAPANAAPPGCWLKAGHNEAAGSHITGYRYWLCEDGDDIMLWVSVQRYLSPGVYQTVASGYGYATYHCGGTLYNVYRTVGSSFGILCS